MAESQSMAGHRRRLGGYSEEEHASVEEAAQRRDAEVAAQRRDVEAAVQRGDVEAVVQRGDAEVAAPGEGIGDNFFCRIYKHGKYGWLHEREGD